MAKYESIHFAPQNNRSILMPRIPKEEAFRRSLEGHKVRPKYPPVSEEKLNSNPYYQCNLGLFLKELPIGDLTRHYGIYVPDGMMSKGTGVVLFLPSGIRAAEFEGFENWKALSEEFHTAFLLLESGPAGWTRETTEADFDFAWEVVSREFSGRLTVDICEACFYPMGLGDAAATAAAFALTYSATFPAFAADGDCNVDPDLLEVLRKLPSDGVRTLKKTDIAISGFVIDRQGQAEALKSYLLELLRVNEHPCTNRFGQVFRENPRRGEWFVNGQPTAEVWFGQGDSEVSRQDTNRAMLRFVLRWSLWGGFGNNHRRLRESSLEMGMQRFALEVDGLPRFFDLYVPSSYRAEEGKAYPLVVAIHGMSCNAEYFEKTSEWHRLAEERGFLVAYASAYPHNDGVARFPVPHWALKTMDVPVVDELPYFRALLDTVQARYSVDTRRIYAAGHSNGGQMTQKLLREMPETFAAFCPTGALLGWREDQVELPVSSLTCPVWIMMGEYDVADPTPETGSMAEKTIREYAKANRAVENYDNWYDNGRYHTLSLYNSDHIPVLRYTIIQGCPHTYTPEMAQMAWDEWFCHFTREPDGTVHYHG